MKLRNSLIILGMLVATAAFAQEVDKATVEAQAKAASDAAAGLKSADTGEKDWKFSGVVGANAAATGLWNWAAGGNNNVNGVVYGRFRLLYHKNNIAWDTNLDMEYGLSWIDQDADALQKSSDKLNFTTKFGWEFHDKWYLTALAGFNTQFAYGRAYDGTSALDPINSKFLAPAYTDISVGIDWKPNDIFSVYLSPVAGRFTTVHVGQKLQDQYAADFAGANLDETLKDKYAVAYYDKETNVKMYDKSTRAEFGLSFKGNINYTYKELKLQTSLGLFTPYAWDKTVVGTSDNGKDIFRDNNRRFGNFDVDWTTAISYQFFNCLQVTLSTDLRYYNGVMIEKTWMGKDDVEHTQSAERVQFKGILGVGIGYSF